MIHNKIHLIRPGCFRPSIALTVQNHGLKHHSFHFISLGCPRPSISLTVQNHDPTHHTFHFISRRVLGSAHQHVLHPNNLAVFEDYVYWTDWTSKSINRFSKFSGNQFSKVLNRAGKPWDMRILHTVLQPESKFMK